MTGSSLRLSMVSERGAGQLPWDSGCSRDAGLGEGHVGAVAQRARAEVEVQAAAGGRRYLDPVCSSLTPRPPSLTIPACRVRFLQREW